MPKKILKGKVTSTKMEKTVVVAVEVNKKHPIYNKTIKATRKFKARDEIGVSLGNVVLIEEHSPFSKEVSWLVKEVLTKKEN
ncbi:MAG TPA: 30S ribosomal protein S17 [candidate division WWE3 bacterium]|uniref:Small ribosomal subunit protein uS17 n=1 Tax=candidate division WWE3 bacterium TaxID=2053526 RepID=A0A7C1DPD4_UNCKA|nr:30S ribosomal protein S17 [candidate division WWE3 bacterium]